jgi:hypothetical protein
VVFSFSANAPKRAYWLYAKACPLHTTWILKSSRRYEALTSTHNKSSDAGGTKWKTADMFLSTFPSKTVLICKSLKINMAEGVGFEPTDPRRFPGFIPAH